MPAAIVWRSKSGWNDSVVHYARSCGNTLNVRAWRGVIDAEVNRTMSGHRHTLASRRFTSVNATVQHAMTWCERQAKRHAIRG